MSLSLLRCSPLAARVAGSPRGTRRSASAAPPVAAGGRARLAVRLVPPPSPYQAGLQAGSRRTPRLPSPPAAAESESADDSLKLLGTDVYEDMKGVNIFVVGDNTEANMQLSGILAKALGYTPLGTPQLVEQFAGQSIQSVVDDEGITEAVLAEAQVLEQVCQFVRVCVATWGGGLGAAARGDCWRYMFGGVSVWLDIGGEEGAPQNDAYELAELQVKLAPGSDAEALDAAAEQVLKGVRQLVDGDEQLCGKKSFYVRMGSRGDWPNIQPPNWDPNKPDENTDAQYEVPWEKKG